jgi:hypothetical protein
MPNGDDPQPIGMPPLRQLLIFAAVAAFIVIYYVALRKVWLSGIGGALRQRRTRRRHAPPFSRSRIGLGVETPRPGPPGEDDLS